VHQSVNWLARPSETRHNYVLTLPALTLHHITSYNITSHVRFDVWACVFFFRQQTGAITHWRDQSRWGGGKFDFIPAPEVTHYHQTFGHVPHYSTNGEPVKQLDGWTEVSTKPSIAKTTVSMFASKSTFEVKRPNDIFFCFRGG
jgi:hypothetical protein